ncbi:sugar transferase [Paracoccus aerius]
MTGLWQISERGDADLGVQQQLDDFYISGRSLWGDLSIFLRTFSAVLGRGGAF